MCILKYQFRKQKNLHLSGTIRNTGSSTFSRIKIIANLIKVSNSSVVETQYSDEVSNLEAYQSATPSFRNLTIITKGDFSKK